MKDSWRDEEAAVGQPLGLAPRTALGQHVERPSLDVHHDEVGHAMTVPHADEPVAVRVPRQVEPVVAPVGELTLAGAVGPDEVDLVPAGALGGEGQGGAVG